MIAITMSNSISVKECCGLVLSTGRGDEVDPVFMIASLFSDE